MQELTENVVISMEDEYFPGCMSDLEDALLDGWVLKDSEYDETSNSNFLTLTKLSIA